MLKLLSFRVIKRIIIIIIIMINAIIIFLIIIRIIIVVFIIFIISCKYITTCSSGSQKSDLISRQLFVLVASVA